MASPPWSGEETGDSTGDEIDTDQALLFVELDERASQQTFAVLAARVD
jgi:hypothetical protein